MRKRDAALDLELLRALPCWPWQIRILDDVFVNGFPARVTIVSGEKHVASIPVADLEIVHRGGFCTGLKPGPIARFLCEAPEIVAYWLSVGNGIGGDDGA